MSRDLVVISAYRPNPPNSGKGTVWWQQKAHFIRTQRSGDPREAFTSDISTEITSWRDQGCEIVLGLDANEDLTVYRPSSFRQLMSDIGLKEVILSKHGGPFQATYQRNLRNQPIDGLFATSGVPILAAGYYPFNEHISSDHRGLSMEDGH